MKMWIARDKDDNSLCLYVSCPRLSKYGQYWECPFGTSYLLIDKNLFPEVTFENSPQQVEIKLIENECNK